MYMYSRVSVGVRVRVALTLTLYSGLGRCIPRVYSLVGGILRYVTPVYECKYKHCYKLDMALSTDI